MWISAVTAFIIAGGGSVGVVAASGYEINYKTGITAFIVGMISAAKDIRSQLKLPPLEEGTKLITTQGQTTTIPPQP